MEKEILISEDKLKNVILNNKEYIGLDKGEGLDRVIAGIGFLITIVVAIFKFEWIKYVFIFLGSVYLFIGGKTLYKSFKNVYTHKDLIEDIKKLDQIEYRHSIVAIKNTFEKFPNKYLTYYDKKWTCDFFLNYKTVDDMESVIRDKLSNQLKIDKESIRVEFKGEDIHRKFSVSNGFDKTYHHYFYLVTISKFDDLLKNDSFEIEGYEYKWMSIKEMRDDPHTYEINSDVINKVDELM